MADEELPSDIWPHPEQDDATYAESMGLLRRNEMLMNIHLLGQEVDQAMARDFPDGTPSLQYSAIVGYKKRMLDVVYDPVSDRYALYMGYVGPGTTRPQAVSCEGVLRREVPDHPGDFDLYFEDPLERANGQPIPLVMHVKTKLVTEMKMGQRITRPDEQTTLMGIFDKGEVDMRLHETRAIQESQALKPPYRAGPLNTGWVDGPPEHLKPGVTSE